MARSGVFTEPSASREAVTALQDLSSPVSAFVRDECVVGPEYEVTKDGLWDAWKRWSERNGRSRPGTKATFGRDLMAAYPTIRTARPRNDGDRVYMYQGIDLTPQFPQPRTTLDRTDQFNSVQHGPRIDRLSSEKALRPDSMSEAIALIEREFDAELVTDGSTFERTRHAPF